MATRDLPDYIINTKQDRATGIRIPRELHRRINERATAEFRTFNSMIVALLEDQIKKPVSEEMFLRLYRKMLDLEKKVKVVMDSMESKGAETMKKLMLFLMLMPTLAGASEIVNPNAKYQIIVSGATIIKMDVVTGATWVLKVGPNDEEFWVPINHGDRKRQ